jgi:apolipoprotein N-acyltransferase
MDDVPAFIALFPGILLGSLLLTFVFHWVRLFLSAIGRNPEEKGIPDRAGRNWMLLFSVIHPVPWLLLLGLPYATYSFFSDPPGAGWTWFIGGAALSVVMVFASAAIVIRKHRTQAESGDHPTVGSDNEA